MVMIKTTKRNYVTGIITKGIYKDKEVKLVIGKTAAESRIFINGKDISWRCLNCTIKIIPDKLTSIYFELLFGE